MLDACRKQKLTNLSRRKPEGLDVKMEMKFRSYYRGGLMGTWPLQVPDVRILRPTPTPYSKIEGLFMGRSYPSFCLRILERILVAAGGYRGPKGNREHCEPSDRSCLRDNAHVDHMAGKQLSRYLANPAKHNSRGAVKVLYYVRGLSCHSLLAFARQVCGCVCVCVCSV